MNACIICTYAHRNPHRHIHKRKREAGIMTCTSYMVCANPQGRWFHLSFSVYFFSCSGSDSLLTVSLLFGHLSEGMLWRLAWRWLPSDKEGVICCHHPEELPPQDYLNWILTLRFLKSTTQFEFSLWTWMHLTWDYKLPGDSFLSFAPHRVFKFNRKLFLHSLEKRVCRLAADEVCKILAFTWGGVRERGLSSHLKELLGFAVSTKEKPEGCGIGQGISILRC